MRFTKYLLLVLLVAGGVLYALPAFYPTTPAVDIVSVDSGMRFSQQVQDILTKAVQKEGINDYQIYVQDGKIRIGVADFAAQLLIKEVAEYTLGDQAIVTLGRLSTVPAWLSAIGARPLNLGLDLQGGVHFVLQVDLPKAAERYIQSLASEIRSALRQEKVRFLPVKQDQDTRIVMQFANSSERDRALDLLQKNYQQFTWETTKHKGKESIAGSLRDEEITQINKYAVAQNITTLRNRVNELGVSEPAVYRQGKDKIVVQLPGVQDATNAKKIIGATANLEFRLEAQPNAPAFTKEAFHFRGNQTHTSLLENDIIVTGDNVSFAKMSFDEHGLPQVEITLDGAGGKMKSATRNAVRRNMAVVFIETKTRANYTTDTSGKRIKTQQPYVEKHIISLATIQAVLGNSFRITGLDNAKEASDLALLLRAGALAAPMYFVQENIIGPSLGAENIEKGTWSLLIGFLLVVLFMLAKYRALGVVANVSLLLNIFLLIAVMSLLHATLTLPGIAGIVLTVGMAVDANVLVFSRIKEEHKGGGISFQQAIEAGYKRAIVTIADANITTLIVAVILFAIGTGAVKGFAITLAIGIITSITTAVFVSRILVRTLATTSLPVRYYLW